MIHFRKYYDKNKSYVRLIMEILKFVYEYKSIKIIVRNFMLVW